MTFNLHPKISVVMGVYNGENHVRDSIDSILNQTFTDFEFIIINDGSTDNTPDVLNSYSDPRLRVYHQSNIGLTKTLNRGLELAKGNLIARQDADDISTPDRFKEQIKFMEKNPSIGLLGTFVSAIDVHGNEFAQWKYPESHDEIAPRLIKDNVFCHGSVLFRRECIKTVGSYRKHFLSAQDYDLWLRISEHFKTANLPSFLYKLRRSSGSITRRKMNQQILFHLLAIELAKERRTKGTDSLQTIDTDDIESYLQNKYHVDPMVIRIFKSECFMSYFHESMRLKDYFSAVTLWSKAFLIKPDQLKIVQFINAIRNN